MAGRGSLVRWTLPLAGLPLLLAMPAPWSGRNVRAAGAHRQAIVVSPVQEVAWGSQARRSFLETRRQSGDGNLGLRVDRIGRTVARVSDRPNHSYQFIVVEGRELQAYAFPGGTVCITESLARLHDSDDELAFSLAHELAHIVLRHHVHQLRMQQALRDGAPGEVALLETVKGLFDRDSELEADRFGALYAVRAGYRYTATHEALTRVGGTGVAGRQDQAHPGFTERIAALREFRHELERSLEAFRRGVSSLRNGRASESIAMLNLFVAEFPRSVSGRINLGGAYLARVRDKAGTPRGLSEVLLPILPDPGIAVRGFVDTVDLHQARNHFERALEVRSDAVLAHAGLGLALTRLGRYDEARVHLDRALSADPDDPDLYLCRGNVEFLAANYAEAARLYGEAHLRRPDWPEAKKNLALTLEHLGAVDRARDLWSSIVGDERIGPEARAHLHDLTSHDE